MSSFDIKSEVYTEPSRSEHDFLMEALEAVYHKNVALIQSAAYEEIMRLDMYLKGAEDPYTRQNIIDQMMGVRENLTRMKNRMAQEREVRIEQLLRWELDKGRHRG